MGNVMVFTVKLHDSLLVFESLHTEPAIKPTLEYERTKRNIAKQLIGIRSPHPASIESTGAAERNEANNEIPREAYQEERAEDA